ncbi:MAG: hypothetical protein IJK36_07010 [Bacteroidales bacterium]|nr:hypothetical protein [Bacteroidales bacterium]
MKRLAIVIGIISGLALMAACARPSQVPELEVAEQSRSIEGPSPKLVAVDSLMWRQPDSALTLLLPWFDSCGDVSGNVYTTFDLHYAHLLLSELLYKNYYEQANRAELLQSEAYFDSISLIINDSPHILWSHCGLDPQSPKHKDDLAFLAARAHYMDGVGHYEGDSLVPACREYLKALEIMEGRFGEKDLAGHKAMFMAYAFSRLMEMYSDLYLHEQTICFARLSLEYYQRVEVPSWYKARIFSEIGMQYDMMSQLDSASFYYQNAAAAIDDTNTIMYRDVLLKQALLDYKLDSQRAGETILRLRDLLSRSENTKEQLARSLGIGEVHYLEKQYDSAWTYFNRVFENTTALASKKQAAERLVSICKSQDRQSKILEYAEFLVPFANQEENQSETKSKMTEFYKDFERREAEIKFLKQEKRKARTTETVTSLLLIVISITALFYFVTRRRHRQLQLQHKKTEKLLKKERQIHRSEQAALSGRLRQSNQKVRELKEQMCKQDAVSYTKQGDRSFAFNEEPVCRLIMERVNEGNFLSQMDCTVYKEYALSKEQLMDLRKATDFHFDGFTSRLARAFPELTKRDLDYCCLYLLGLTDSDIAALMQRAYNTINERSNKLKRVIGAKKTLSGALIGFANESQNGDCQDVRQKPEQIRT